MSLKINFLDKAEIHLLKQNNTLEVLLNNPILEKEIWDIEKDLQLQYINHTSLYQINFTPMKNNWIKLLTKIYILALASRNYSPITLANSRSYLRIFSEFISEKSIFYPEQINNSTFEEYRVYLQNCSYSNGTINHILSAIKGLLVFCRQENIFNVDTYWFEGKLKDLPVENDEIIYIPEEVYQQLTEALHYYPEPIQRMILIIRAVGLRVSELLNLPIDCLRLRGDKWYLRFLTGKYLVEDEVIIHKELVAVIQEQQEFIKENLGDSFEYLFCANNSKTGFKANAKIMAAQSFNRWLNKIAKEQNIVSKDGQLWHFTSHQFRRTIATVMDNLGLRSLIIEKYLRHRSTKMQKHYKRLLKQTLKAEYEELVEEKKYVDIAGKIITQKPSDPISELMRRRMHQITTPYGECHRSIIMSPCPNVNSCWGCEDWLTSKKDLKYLKSDTKKVEAELNMAIKLGMIRQEKGLRNTKKILTKRIKILETLDD